MKSKALLELSLFLFPVKDFDFIYSTCTCYNSVIGVRAKATCIDVGHFLFVFDGGPSNGLFLLEFGIVPYLYLILSRITSNEQLIIGIVDRVSCDMRSVERFHTFPHSRVPLMNHWIPASRNQNVLINEFNTKYPIAMSFVVPFCISERCAYALCIYITYCLL